LTVKCSHTLTVTVKGEPAAWLNEWKCCGLTTSYTDIVIQALCLMNEKVTEQDLKSAQLSSMKNEKEPTVLHKSGVRVILFRPVLS